MSTHTPGPWIYHAPSTPVARPFVTRADGYSVAECMIAGEADARLIAAAPELLAAAEALESWTRDEPDALTSAELWLSGCPNELRGHVAKLRAAIAKARGVTS